MASMERLNDQGREIQALLKLEHPPIAVSFTDEVPRGVKSAVGPVPSGCVFWFKAFDGEFYTTREDHANCNIGSFTHGFTEPSQMSPDACADIGMMVQAEYLRLSDLASVPRMKKASKYVVYAPLRSASLEPQVVLIVCNAEQAMLISEASGTTKTLGKPTCSAIPYALDKDEVAISLGCITSRVRTGLKPGELIVTVPRRRLDAFVARLGRTARSNDAVSRAVAAMLLDR